jgi:transposase-like protein
MDEKIRLMAALTMQEDSVSELCADFGISRKTAYKWWARYRQAQANGTRARCTEALSAELGGAASATIRQAAA